MVYILMDSRLTSLTVGTYCLLNVIFSYLSAMHLYSESVVAFFIFLWLKLNNSVFKSHGFECYWCSDHHTVNNYT